MASAMLLLILLSAGCACTDAMTAAPQELLAEARGFFPWLQHHRRYLIPYWQHDCAQDCCIQSLCVL